MKNDAISFSVIKRLPRYYRFLGELKANGIIRISSKELSQRMGLTASQIRQDFNCFGGFGQQGYGYNVEQLHREIGSILGVHSGHKAIILGAGNLGRLVSNQITFETKGFSLIGIFDRKESLTGQMIKGIPVRHINGLDEFCKENLPEMAVLCIPPESARELVPLLIKLGIKAFWNFSHYDVALNHPGVAVENVHLGDSLMTLCYKIN
jgi:redox-sensing transcriptional repressor